VRVSLLQLGKLLLYHDDGGKAMVRLEVCRRPRLAAVGSRELRRIEARIVPF